MAGKSKPQIKTGRSAVYTNGGVVASISPLAASAGVRVLADGGNAFDAAIATAAVEAVTVSAGCGLGGEPFVIMYEAKTASMAAAKLRWPPLVITSSAEGTKRCR